MEHCRLPDGVTSVSVRLYYTMLSRVYFSVSQLSCFTEVLPMKPLGVLQVHNAHRVDLYNHLRFGDIFPQLNYPTIHAFSVQLLAHLAPNLVGLHVYIRRIKSTQNPADKRLLPVVNQHRCQYTTNENSNVDVCSLQHLGCPWQFGQQSTYSDDSNGIGQKISSGT